MKPSYMGPNSPVKTDFKEFCASEAMDSEPHLLSMHVFQANVCTTVTAAWHGAVTQPHTSRTIILVRAHLAARSQAAALL